MAKRGGIGRTLWGQVTTPRPTDTRTTSRRTPAAPSEGAADTEPDEPKLSELQRRRIDSEARQAGRTAMVAWATAALPYAQEPRYIQVVASWLLTLDKLSDFHRRVLEGGGSEHISGSIELRWGGRVSRNSLDGGLTHFLFSPSALAGSFEESALAVARAFCGYTESDEIHEIRGSNWMLMATVVDRNGSLVPRTYVHKAERGSLRTQLSRELSGLNEIFARSDEARERHKSRLRELMDAELAILVADALGHGRDMKRAYDTAYRTTFEEKEADVLRDLDEGRRGRRRRR